MRFRNSLFLVGIIALCTVGLVLFGCSDDDNPPTINNNNVVDYVLEAVTAQVNEHLDTTVARFDAGISVAGVTSTDIIDDRLLGPLIPDSSVEVDNWFVWFASDLEAGVGIAIIDSLQYLYRGVAQADAVGADELTFTHYYTCTHGDTTVSYANTSLQSDLDLTNIDNVAATINGNVNTDIHSKLVTTDSTVWEDWTIEAAVSEVTVQKKITGWDTGCPATGTVQVNVTYTRQNGTANPSSTEWVFTATFDDGVASVDVTNTDDLSTSYEEQVCNP